MIRSYLKYYFSKNAYMYKLMSKTSKKESLQYKVSYSYKATTNYDKSFLLQVQRKDIVVIVDVMKNIMKIK